MARGFEYDDNSGPVSLITSFECFEHLCNPTKGNRKDVKKLIISYLQHFFCRRNSPSQKNGGTTACATDNTFSFYSRRTLRYLAAKFDLELYTNGRNIHFLTETKNWTYFILTSLFYQDI